MLTKDEIEYVRTKLREAKRPLFFFDDDVDGMCSFVQLYRMCTDAKGVCVKGKPIVEEKYADKVDEYQPDLVIIMDKPLIQQEFLDRIKVEKLWIDHHPVQDMKGVKYFNPRKHDESDNKPTSYLAYEIAKDDVKDILWIAAVGTFGDWNTCLLDEARNAYPDLVPADISKPQDALFRTRMGELVQILNFNLKGSTMEVMKSVKVMTRIESPYEILDKLTPRGKFLFKKAQPIKEKYEQLKKLVKATKDNFIIFKYQDSSLAISSDLSNELLFEHPDKIIVIAREKSDEVMMSIRSSAAKIVDKLQVALQGVEGYGGGHDFACGACVKKKDYDLFIERFREQFK